MFIRSLPYGFRKSWPRFQGKVRTKETSELAAGTPLQCWTDGSVICPETAAVSSKGKENVSVIRRV